MAEILENNVYEIKGIKLVCIGENPHPLSCLLGEGKQVNFISRTESEIGREIVRHSLSLNKIEIRDGGVLIYNGVPSASHFYESLFRPRDEEFDELNNKYEQALRKKR